MNKKGPIIVLAVLALILIAKFGLNTNKDGDSNTNLAQDKISTSSTTERTVGGVTFTSENGSDIKIEQIPVENEGAPRPSLTVTKQFSASLDTATQVSISTSIRALLDKLGKDASSQEDWLVLGTYYKIAGDYKQASFAWEYVSARWPNNNVSYANLGDLYAYSLVDKDKALANFKSVVANNPTSVSAYRALYEFVLNVLGDEKFAVSVLQDGIKANPSQSAELKALLSSHAPAQ